MNPKEQRIAIADWVGWRDLNTRQWTGTPPGAKEVVYGLPIPNYLNDLNDIQKEVINLIRLGNMASQYAQHLWEITGGQKQIGFLWGRDNNHGMLEYIFAMANASAGHRCEALLRTIDKWNE